MSKSQNTKNEQLTEQYKHGNLPDDRLYYYRFKGKPDVQITTQYGLYCEEADNKKEIEILAEVPSFKEYERILVEMASLKQIRDELDCSVTQLREDKINLEEENNKLWQSNKEVANRNIDLIIKLNTLKELLTEIRRKIKTFYDMDLNQFITSAAFTDDFVKKIDEVLNA